MSSPEAKERSHKILIADDESINQRLMFYHLKTITEDLLFANDGSEAVKMYAENPDVSVVLMDLRMPMMNGIEATSKILEIDSNAKIIALSAFAEEENDFDSKKAGFSGYLTKPIRKDLLIETVTRFLV